MGIVALIFKVLAMIVAVPMLYLGVMGLQGVTPGGFVEPTFAGSLLLLYVCLAAILYWIPNTLVSRHILSVSAYLALTLVGVVLVLVEIFGGLSRDGIGYLTNGENVQQVTILLPLTLCAPTSLLLFLKGKKKKT